MKAAAAVVKGYRLDEGGAGEWEGGKYGYLVLNPAVLSEVVASTNPLRGTFKSETGKGTR